MPFTAPRGSVSDMPSVSTRTHAATGALATGAAMLLRRLRLPAGRWFPLLAIGVGELALAALTKRRSAPAIESQASTSPSVGGGPSGPTTAPPAPPAAAPVEAAVDAPAPVAAAIDAPAPVEAGPAAPPPIETPGPSVTPPEQPESDVERTARIDAALPEAGEGDTLVAQQEAAAAAEAAAIGGRVPHETEDPAMEPVYEAGGGEQDGWEAAEADLVENATHGDPGASPERDAFTPEVEADRSTAVYGEPDEEHSSEVEETDR